MHRFSFPPAAPARVEADAVIGYLVPRLLDALRTPSDNPLTLIGRLATVVGALAVAAPAWGQDWIPLDARSRAVGGAGVAFSEGPAAAYWNPARLTSGAEMPFDFATGYGFDLSVGADAGLEGQIAADLVHVIDLHDSLDVTALRDRVNAGTHTAADIQDAVELLSAVLALDDPGKGVLLNAASGFDLKIGPFGLFGRALGTVAADPFFDIVASNSTALTTGSLASFFQPLGGGTLSAAADALRVQLESCGLSGANFDSDGDGVGDAAELAFQAQTAIGIAGISDPQFIQYMCQIVQTTLNPVPGTTTFAFDGSGLELRGIAQFETGISFGLPIYPALLSVGIALKEIVTETFYARIKLSDTEGDKDVMDVIEDAFDARTRDNDFNVDLGAELTPLPGLRLGLSGRNLLPMKFDFAGGGGEVKMRPQVRFGAAYTMLGFITVGADYDVTENKSDLLKGYTSQMIGGGVEFDLTVIELRAGIMKNVGDSGGGEVVTAGVGLDLYFLRLDVAGQMGLDEFTIPPTDPGDDPLDVPDRASVSVTLGVKVGF